MGGVQKEEKEKAKGSTASAYGEITRKLLQRYFVRRTKRGREASILIQGDQI